MRYRFGDCTLDLDTRELARGEKSVHVEPKAFKLLELLFAARPKALSKDELQDVLWPKTFVSERSLARLVEVLRDCLGDSAKQPRYIRTVHGFGYAFSAEAIEVAPARTRISVFQRPRPLGHAFRHQASGQQPDFPVLGRIKRRRLAQKIH